MTAEFLSNAIFNFIGMGIFPSITDFNQPTSLIGMLYLTLFCSVALPLKVRIASSPQATWCSLDYDYNRVIVFSTSSVQYKAFQLTAVQYAAVQYMVMQYSVVQYNAVLYSVVQYKVFQLPVVEVHKQAILTLTDELSGSHLKGCSGGQQANRGNCKLYTLQCKL